MKLYASPTSPYARLVRVVLAEKGAGERVETVWTDPWADPAELTDANPLGRVPTLVDEDGTVLTESAIIALFLEQRFPKPTLVPPARLAHAYHKLGLGQGLLDGAVGVIAPRRLGGGGGDGPLAQRRLAALERMLPRLGEERLTPGAPPDLGDLAIAVALAYLDFRLPDLAWAQRVPSVMAWHREILARESLRETAPEGGR